VLPWMATTLGLAAPGDRVASAADLLDRFEPARIPRQPVVYGDGDRGGGSISGA